MKSRLRFLRILILCSLLTATQAALAQTADDFFNSGARFYISNNIPNALTNTERGLKLYPDDIKLKKLYELLKQQNKQQSQNQQQKQQQQKEQSKSSKQQSQAQQQQADKQNQPRQNPAQRRQARENQTKPGNLKNQENQAGQMTPQEAKQLLNSQKDNEKFLFSQNRKRSNSQPVPKDW